MEVTTTPTASNTAGTTTGTPSQSNNSVISSDFETFIRMLTVQMENQDPLNPIESSDFSTQLATFSGVEQQVLTNDLLQGLSGQLGALGVSQLSGWIGMEGRAVAPVAFDGSAVDLTISGSDLADYHELVVHNSNGVEVQRYEVSGDQKAISWQGTAADGSTLPAGTYQISVESFFQDAQVATTPAQIRDMIVEARLEGNETILVMQAGQAIPASDLLGLRAPQ